MPVDDFAAARGGTIPIVSKEECKKVWEPRFRDEICKGTDPRQPEALNAATTVAAFITDYKKRSLRGAATEHGLVEAAPRPYLGQIR